MLAWMLAGVFQVAMTAVNQGLPPGVPQPALRLQPRSAGSLVQIVPDPPTGSPCRPPATPFPRVPNVPQQPDPGILRPRRDRDTDFLIRRVVPRSCADAATAPERRDRE
jgi:hypothetical protein